MFANPIKYISIATVFTALTLSTFFFLYRPAPLHAAAPDAKPLPAQIDFNRDIKPILSDKCFHCHGPDEKHREAKLRLDTKDDIFKDRGGYHIVKPGSLEDSELIYLITAEDEDERMPPPNSTKSLKPREIELLKLWVKQGAKWQGHWSLTPPTKPNIPTPSNPKWPINPIDNFIHAELDRVGLHPNPQANKYTLIRRVTLDLTGLPPTPQEVQAFVNDQSPDAYEKVVDRLLNSPHFAEHIARYWLDAARYGDTHGLHLDNYREFWPYRDYVINSFHQNKPFDQFITEQLAGDLLPNPTTEQLVATGFNRAHVTTAEGGSIKQEVFIRNVTDRTDTFGTVFLGMTVGCAVCHDHKYDPISQKDYYSLSAFFNSLDADPMDGNKKDHAPVIKVPTKEQKEKIAEYDAQIKHAQHKITQKLAAIKYEEPANPAQPVKPEPVEVVWIDDNAPPGAKLEGNGTGPNSWVWVTKDKEPVYSGNRASKRTAKGLSQHFFQGASQKLKVGAGDKVFAYVYLDPKNPPKEIMLQFNTGAWSHRAYWGENLINWGTDKSPQRRHIGPLPETGKWIRLEVDAAHLGLNPGMQISGWAFTQFDGTVYWDKAGIVTKTSQNLYYDSFNQWLADSRAAKAAGLPKNIADLVNTDPTKLNPDHNKVLKDYFFQFAYTQTHQHFADLRTQITNLQNQRKSLENAFATTLIWKETKKPRDAHILNRGEYDQPTTKVPRDVPPSILAFPKDAPRDRLGLAKWLLQPNHPLFTRVTVNRFWQQFFGTGIVKTAEDFGAQGEPPSHPELLDYLAVDFRDNGWNVKRTMKQIVMSATYRQSPTKSSHKLKIDPDNRLLASGPHLRLQAEILRDQALYTSGLLVDKIGGPSVKPPQPAGLWNAVGYTGSNTANFKADTGPEKIFRRSVYTFWKRTSPPPMLSTFDAPSRENCTVRRENTNTPLQALLVMNEQQYVEAARHLAQRSMLESDQPEQIARNMFFRLTQRPPSKVDMTDLLDAYNEFLATYKSKPEEARKLINVGSTKPNDKLDPSQLAAWTMVANILYNLDEVINH